MRLLVILLLLIKSSLIYSIEGPKLTSDYQQNPSEINWKYILTEHFHIIFPEDVSHEAQRVANLLEKIYPYVCRSMEVLPPRIPLILQNQSVNSNGFVTLAPRRSEWFLSPSIDPELTNTEWLKTLAIHEFRHVVQFHKTKQGFNKFYRALFGQIGEAIGVALTLPPWFMEGDAVGIETALSNGGRGRLPLFERDLRAVLLSDLEWNYDKSHLGSYKDYVPNHYVYGYFYTTWLRNNYGDLVLSEIADKASERSWNPLTFYNATRKITGHTFESLYKKMMKEFSSNWKAKIDLLSPTPSDELSPKKKDGWTNYLYPQVVADGKILALKMGLSFIPEFVLIENGKEKHLLYPGILQNEYPYKLRNGKLVFHELQIDPRWGYRDYTTLKVFDIEKKEIILERKNQKARLGIPSHDGLKLIQIEWDEFQNQFLVVLNIRGKELLRIPYPKEKVITSLDWVESDQIVLVIKDHLDQKAIVKFNFNDRSEQVLLSHRYMNIGAIAVQDNQILYEAPDSGIDNIWLLTSQGPKQLTSALFGAYSPTLFSNQLFYSDYSLQGMKIVKKNLNWDEEQSSSDSFVPVYEKFSKSEDFKGLQDDLTANGPYRIGEYSQLENSVNLHSWVLLAPPLSNTVTFMGISRDLLNKFALTFGAEYNLNEKVLQGFTSALWSNFFTAFDLRAGYGGRRQTLVQSGRNVENQWEEGTFEAGVSLPWRKINGRFSQVFSTRAFSKLIKVTNKSDSNSNELSDGVLFSPGVEASFEVSQRLARRDILPRYGFSLNSKVEDGKEITSNQKKGQIISFDSRAYLPGLFHHHSFHHQFAYESQKAKNYQYASDIFSPRGTSSFYLDEFSKYSANYLFPAFYPDWNLSRYLYSKRISFNFFYDELNGRFSNISYKSASTGLETIFELNLLRLSTPLNIGVRWNYVLNGYANKKVSYDIFFSSVLGTF